MIKVDEEYVDSVYENLKPAYDEEYKQVVIKPKISREMVKVVLVTAYLVGLVREKYNVV